MASLAVLHETRPPVGIPRRRCVLPVLTAGRFLSGADAHDRPSALVYVLV
ncbi:MAG: hypothetical protein RL173_3754 [Fibrobacterota bacterium]|jgi:hypothetical protein